jgi:PhnB protein
MPVEPYVFFNGRCREALDFYTQAAGARVESIMTYSQNPQPMPEGALPPGWGEKIMHSSAFIGGSRIFLSDGNSPGKATFDGFALTLTVPTVEESARTFSALGAGGTVIVPLGPTFYSPSFGMLFDRFGVMWMIMVSPA